ncbi:unnamed protein product [Mortierella alpina]
MPNDFATRVKNSLDDLYYRVFDYNHHQYGYQYKSQSQSHTQPTPSAAAVSSAISEAASYLNSYLRSLSSSQVDILKHDGQTVCEPPANEIYYDGAPSFCDSDNVRDSAHHMLSSFFQSLTNPGAMWTQWDPSMAFDNILWNYTPDVQALQHRLGLDHLSETYNIDPRIILLTLALPLILLILTACALKGAGHTSDDDPRSPARKADPHQVAQRKENQAGETTKQVRGAGGSSKASPKKGDHSKSSSRGSAQDIEPQTISSHTRGDNYNLSSWGAILGSTGFYGGETMNYKPIDIYAAMKGATLRRDNDQLENNSVGSLVGAKGFYGGETMEHASFKNIAAKGLGNLIHGHVESVQSAAAETSGSQADHAVISPTTKTSKKARRAEKAAAAKGALNSKVEPERQMGVPEPTVLQPQASAPSLSNEKSNVPSYAAVASPVATATREADTTTVHGHQGDFEPVQDVSDTQPRTAVKSKPLRTRTQPPSTTHLKLSEPSRTPAAVYHAHQHQDHNTAGRDLGSRILGFVHGSELLRNMDAFSGGVLGSAVATVAALASTAESTASLIKDNLPDSVTDFTEELKESFDHAMRTGGLEGQGILGQSDEGESWGIRQAISHIIQDDDDRAVAAAVAEAPRKKSFAEVAAMAGTQVPASSSHHVDDSSVGLADQTLRKASISYADKVKSHATGTGGETEVHSESRRKSVHNERENEDYFLEDDSGDDADDDNDGEDDEDDDDENVDDGSRHTHPAVHADTALPSSDAHGHHRHHQHQRVHPHDAPHTETKFRGAAEKNSSSTREADRKTQEFTVDQHGNKVPVADVRRDSGFDLLV